MSQEQELRTFVKENFRLLLGDPFPNNLYEEKKRDFYGRRLKHKYRRPKKSEVAKTLMGIIIKSIQNHEELEHYFSKPLIMKNLPKKAKEIYLETISIKTSTDEGIDYKRLKDEAYKQLYKGRLKEEVMKESSAEITAAIEKKRAAYLATPSVLDSSEFPEPEIIGDISTPSDEEAMPWWRKLELISDPFPGNALYRIDKKLWDDVVYKTSIFSTYQSYINKYPTELYKNTIIFGEYGSGKSTFFEYIQSFLIQGKITPLYVSVYGESDAKSLQIIYEKKLIKKLRSTCNNLNIYSQDAMPQETNELIDVFFDMIIDNGQKGILIIIDDLHKNPSIEAAMEFMSNLQSYSEELQERKPDFNFGICLAGALEWKDTIKLSPLYSGSFLAYIDMPNITPEIAHEAINMRLKAFSGKSKNPKEIKLDAVIRAFDNLISSRTPLTFRHIIKYVIDEFKKGNFDILMHKMLPNELRKIIRNKFDSDHVINVKFNMLIRGEGSFRKIRFEHNIRKIIERLIILYTKRVIYDNDSEILDNKFYYRRLAEVGLITKILDGNKIKWVICKELDDINERIIREHSISLENYLIDIYCSEDEEQEKSSDTKQIYATIYDYPISKNVLNSIKASIDKRIELEDIFSNVEKIKYLQDNEKRIEIRKNIVNSIKELTRALCLFEQISTKMVDEFWMEYWYSTDNIVKYDRYIKNVRNYDDSISSHITISYLYQVYSSCYEDIYEFVEKHIKLSKDWKLPVSDLTREEIFTFYAIRDSWIGGEYNSCLTNASSLFEHKLQKLIFNIFNILYGYDYEKRIDPEILTDVNRKKAFENDMMLSNPIEKEYYSEYQRKHFKDIIINGPYGKTNWEEIFKAVFPKKKAEDILIILDRLSDTNQYIVREQALYIPDEQKEYIKNYVMDVIEHIKLINTFYIKLLNYGYRYKIENKYYILFSCCNRKDEHEIKKIGIDKDANRIFEMLKSKKILRNIPLDDKEHIESYFNTEYRKIYAYLSLLSNISEKEMNQLGIEGKLQVSANRYGGARVDIKYIEAEASTKKSRDSTYKFDAFICHASEDKIDFVTPLAKELTREIKVWYDDFSLKLGDSLRQKIEEGLRDSRYGIVILSKAFFSKEWPQKELDGLISKEVNGKKVILPIWHHVSRDEVAQYSPILVGRVASKSSEGLSVVVSDILDVIFERT